MFDFYFSLISKGFLNSLLKGISRGAVKQRVLQWILVFPFSYKFRKSMHVDLYRQWRITHGHTSGRDMYLLENLIVYANYHAIFVITASYSHLLSATLISYPPMIVHLSLANWTENEASLANLANESLLRVPRVEYSECTYAYKHVLVWCVPFFINMKLLWHFRGVTYGFHRWKAGL